jgi:phosphoribosylformylglycinamidine synthase II
VQDDIPQILAEAMSSEHTSYKSTKKYLADLYTTGSHVIVGPGENAGIVDLGDGYALALRIESHNHPSYIHPYNGAATGVGGIIRDIFTMGARPIALVDILRFGTNHRSRWLREEVVRGIADYGNTIGVPVVGGDVFLDPTYDHNCLVNVAAIGLVKKTNIIFGNALTVGNDLIYVGGKTGRDGVGGAQMASADLDAIIEDAVQEPDPYLEKLLMEACCELAETGWIEGMQDMGAAGLLCSTSEVVIRGRKRTGLRMGAFIDLDLVPVKVGMSTTEILLSESQERMMIVGRREHRDNILALFEHWDLEAHVIGTVTHDDKYTIQHHGELLSMEFNEIFPDVRQDWEMHPWVSQQGKQVKLSKDLVDNIWRQYDWMVGARTIKGPNLPGNYAILDLPEIGKELIISWSSDRGIYDSNPAYGAFYAFEHCRTSITGIGGTPLAVTNCLNFGHPAASMGAFKNVAHQISRACECYRVPIVSGNVSLYNAHEGRSIKPTPVLVMVGLR